MRVTAVLQATRRVIPFRRTAGYTAYMYMEDDTKVTWPALASWARDTELLEPLGFLRNFYRCG